MPWSRVPLRTPLRARPGPGRLWRALLPALLTAGCSSSPSFQPKGVCEPTCAGSDGGAYGGYEEARRAFTRSSGDGGFLATLEDIAWLRFEGDEQETIQKHRAYFDQGYTTFAVTLRTKDFTQPTGETFVLEDSSGARLTGRPQTYKGAMGLEQERFAARFSLSFRHAITRDLSWIRLTRAADNTSLEWTFRAAGPGGGRGQVVSAGRVVKGQPFDPAAQEQGPLSYAGASGPAAEAGGSVSPEAAWEEAPQAPGRGPRLANLLTQPAPVFPQAGDPDDLPPLPPPPLFEAAPAPQVPVSPVSQVPAPLAPPGYGPPAAPAAPPGPALPAAPPPGPPASLPPPAARRLPGVTGR